MAMAMGAVQISRMWRLNRELRRLCNAQFNLSNRLFYLLFRQAISPTKLNLGEKTGYFTVKGTIGRKGNIQSCR